MSKRAYDLIVIGAGSGGLTAAWDAAVKYGQKVAVVDVQKSHGPPYYSAIGGTCVNVGCVPKKLFMQGATYREHFKDAKGFGWQIDADKVGHDWKAMIAAKNKAVKGINDSYLENMLGDSQKNLDFFGGWGSFVDNATVAVRKTKEMDSDVVETLSAPSTIISTGGWPFIPSDVEGKEHIITSNEAFYLPECPERTLIVGGGLIAVEFAGIFQSFKPENGVVEVAHRGDLWLRGFDDMIREELATQMKARGIKVTVNKDVSKIELVDGRKKVTFADGSTNVYDCVMYATGRVPKTEGLGLDRLGVALNKGAVAVDAVGKTNVDGLYALGDVTNRIQLTPVAIHEGSCLVKTIFGKQPTVPDHDKIAAAIFAIPQAGTCGLTEEQAKDKYSKLRVYTTRGTPLMHQLTKNEHKKYNMKVIVDHETDVVVGVHLVFPEAAEVIQLVGVAMKCGVKFAHFSSTIGVHPSTSEDLTSMEPSHYYLNGEKHETKPADL